MKVAKFGGTSLADAKQLLKVYSIVKADPARRIIVVSAPGKRSSDDVKVTDMLIKCAEQKLAGKTAEPELLAIVDRFAGIQKDAGVPVELIEEIEKDLRQRLNSNKANRDRFIDLVKAAGEDNNAKLVAAVFRKHGLDAVYMSPKNAGLLLTAEHGNALVLEESYKNLSESLKGQKGVVVFPGFFGCTNAGEIVTFPRGGSDITGAVLAVAVKADVYENFTDVDSVFAADPTIVKDAQPISLLTYREMRELSYAGFHVFHDEAIIPAVHAKIPINIRNTNKPEAPGTMIVPERTYTSGDVVGIASSDGFCAVNVDKYLMNREIGFGRRLLQIMEEEKLSYEHAPSGIDNMSVILREKDFTSETEVRIIKRLTSELKADNVDIDRGLALVMIVGEGMHYTVGMAARATAALANAGVNIEMLNQGSSEISMMYGVKAVDRKKAVKALYEAFF
ncbi:MAG: aspartate kinase [Kiritimatiellae bacterium]|nr:aspartate kinase [Kiritimatiellia bacterium]MDD5522110.1 aspartate kinase [Kiritimatiellia bacterium]